MREDRYIDRQIDTKSIREEERERKILNFYVLIDLPTLQIVYTHINTAYTLDLHTSLCCLLFMRILKFTLFNTHKCKYMK